MKLRLFSIALSTAFFACLTAAAQAPAGAPAGSTAQCKDGSYWTGATKSGACRGHKGLQTWFGSSSPATSKPSPATTKPAAVNKAAVTPAPAATPAPTSKPSRSMPAPAANAAPGGGPGTVWVNTSTKVYHCSGDRYYGKTKDGKYMSEADAKGMGAKPARGQPCSK